MFLGEIIKEYRIKHDMTMDDFASKSGISKGYISMLEKNENPKTKEPIAPSLAMLNKVSKAMNIPIDDLFKIVDGGQLVFLDTEKSTPLLTDQYSRSVNEEPVGYYLDNETSKIAQEIFDNPELRMLFDASRKVSPDDLRLVAEMVKRMSGDND